MKNVIILLSIICSLVIASPEQDQRLIIFNTNDMYGVITEQDTEYLNTDFPSIPGGDSAASNIIFKFRKMYENIGDPVLALDAGDIFQGTPSGAKTKGQTIAEYIQKHSPLKIREEIRLKKSNKEAGYFKTSNYYFASMNHHMIIESENKKKRTTGQRLLNNISKAKNSISPQEKSKSAKPHFDPVIGSTGVYLKLSKSGESPMNNFICDVMRIAANGEFAFMNPGDISGEFPQGPIRHLDMFRLLPFGRKLVVMEIAGTDLKKLVEKTISGFREGLVISGGKVEYNPERENHNRLTYFEVAGNPVYPKRVYRVVTTDYLSEGNAGFGMLKEFENIKFIPTGIILRNVVEQFIKENSPINTKIDSRWIRK